MNGFVNDIKQFELVYTGSRIDKVRSRDIFYRNLQLLSMNDGVNYFDACQTFDLKP